VDRTSADVEFLEDLPGIEHKLDREAKLHIQEQSGPSAEPNFPADLSYSGLRTILPVQDISIAHKEDRCEME
jgi:hypothetical protein